ncbi:hypothetical protein C8R43DRAFT_1175 [Mycena crocata]|nr:hypothetical protein C8R43DRAFT_1175 [Mycena crocata]
MKSRKASARIVAATMIARLAMEEATALATCSRLSALLVNPRNHHSPANDFIFETFASPLNGDVLAKSGLIERIQERLDSTMQRSRGACDLVVILASRPSAAVGFLVTLLRDLRFDVHEAVLQTLSDLSRSEDRASGCEGRNFTSPSRDA